MTILLTNDDGIHAPGLRAIYSVLKNNGHEVYCIAPASQMSAVGHSITMYTPLRTNDVVEPGFRGISVSGTPADCVKIALRSLLPEIAKVKPDLVVSGINAGANVGIDVLYSGTVSAAIEATLLGVPAVALSCAVPVFDNFAPHAKYSAEFIEKKLWQKIPNPITLNINFPAVPFNESKKLQTCPLSCAAYNDEFNKRVDPHKQPYYWLTGNLPCESNNESDRALLNRGHITLTPLSFNLTDVGALGLLSSIGS